MRFYLPVESVPYPHWEAVHQPHKKVVGGRLPVGTYGPTSVTYRHPLLHRTGKLEVSRVDPCEQVGVDAGDSHRDQLPDAPGHVRWHRTTQAMAAELPWMGRVDGDVTPHVVPDLLRWKRIGKIPAR